MTLEEKRNEVHEAREQRREAFEEKYEVPVSSKPRWARLTKADLFKLGGLVVFFLLVGVMCYFLLPKLAVLSEPNGAQRLIEEVRNAGVAGAAMLFALQFLQIVVAFIPGEVVQIAAGAMYGPWLGALIIIIGAVASSAFVYVVVHRLGAPFVRAMIPEKWMAKLEIFEQSEKLDVMVFILFLIPGMPKDTITYLVPLTNMGMRNFLVISNVGRIPGVLISTFCADGLMAGDYTQSIILFVIAVAIAVVAVWQHERILRGAAHLQGFGKKKK